MPDTRTLRGPHPKDAEGFSPTALGVLQNAVHDLSLLLSRGYPKKASLKLVGDRYSLRDRQRQAVQRCCMSEASCQQRQSREVDDRALLRRSLWIDGYNVLLTLEAALSSGVLLLGRDGALRDMAAMSHHYRRVHTTRPALHLVADFCGSRGCTEVVWYFDQPISNSGRLRKLISGLAADHGWPWQVHLVPNPDSVLSSSSEIVSTSDGAILERCQRWFNLTRRIVAESIPDAWLIDLSSQT